MLSLYSFAVALGLYIILFVTVQPYKIAVYNKTDAPLLMALLMIVFSIGPYCVYVHHYCTLSSGQLFRSNISLLIVHGVENAHKKLINSYHMLNETDSSIHRSDTFQGCYKDGTNETRDCRYFAGLQLVLRLLFPLIFFS